MLTNGEAEEEEEQKKEDTSNIKFYSTRPEDVKRDFIFDIHSGFNNHTT